MLQRQIMLKQLQELQRSQKLQELDDPRNQDYINQLTSLKQASSLQFSPTANGEPLRDSQMLAMGNMQMMQHGGTGVFQGFPNGLVVSQGQNHGRGLSMAQFNGSCYGSSPHLNLYSQFQGLSNQSDNMLAKNNSRSLGMPAMHPLGLSGSFSNQQGNFSSDHNSTPDAALLPDQIFQENNLFGQSPVQSVNNGLTENYSGQKSRIPIHEDTSWLANSPGNTSNVTMPEADDALDPLERKILYSTDDNLGLSFSGSKLGKRGFEGNVDSGYMDTLSSIQSGSWSALMQSAAAEISSSDNGIQEDWSGLSFNNTDRSPDNPPLNILSNEKLQNNWVDRNLHSVPSPSSEFQKAGISFPGFQQSGNQYPKQQDEFQFNASHTFSQQSQQKHPIGGSQLFQTTSNALPSQGDEARGSLWLHRSALNSSCGSIQNIFDQENQLSVNRFSVETQKLVSGDNDVPLPTRTASSDFRGQNATAQSKSVVELLRKDDISNDEMQLKAKVAHSPMGNSGLTPIQSPYTNDYIKNQTARSHMTAKLPEHNIASSQVNFKPLGPPSVESQLVVFSSESPIHSPRGTSQQDLSTPRSHKFSSNLIQSSDSASSGRESNSGAPNEQPLDNERSINSVGMPKLIPPTDSISQHLSYQADTTENDIPALSAGDVSALGQNLNQNNCVPSQIHSPKSGMDIGKKLPARYDGHYHQAFANARELLLNRQKSSMKEKVESKVELGSLTSGNHNGWNFPLEAQQNQSGKASSVLASAGDVQSHQRIEILRQFDARSYSPGVNDTYSGAYSPQISLQMAPTWFKNHGTLNNNQTFPMSNPNLTYNAPQQFSQLRTGHLLENSTISQENLCNTSQGSGILPALASTLLASGHLSSNVMSRSNAAYQNLDASISKKRKILAFDVLPWGKEVNHEGPRLQNMSISEIEWAQASCRRQEEAKDGAEMVDELPMLQSKRRLIFTTQLIQQVFRPAPAVILRADATSNFDSLVYFASRLALGDACSLISTQQSDIDDVPANKLEVPKRTNRCDLSKLVEGLTGRMKKLEGELSRLEKSLSMVDIKVENQELEKFSIINRFAKFHMKAQQITADKSSTSGPSPGSINHLQRYVMAYPMPKTIPGDFDCLPL